MKHFVGFAGPSDGLIVTLSRTAVYRVPTVNIGQKVYTDIRHKKASKAQPTTIQFTIATYDELS
jgi:hypothetical protein